MWTLASLVSGGTACMTGLTVTGIVCHVHMVMGRQLVGVAGCTVLMQVACLLDCKYHLTIMTCM